jgi:lipopolysaccharide/colanic/teichoic acid biosynthesis glycosyltransferase
MKTVRLRYVILAVDVCWTVVAMALAYILRYEHAWHNPTRIPPLAFMPFVIATIVMWTLLYSKLRLDGFQGGWRFSTILSQLFPTVSGIMLLLLAGGFIARWYMSRLVLTSFGVLFFLGLLGIRLVARAFLASRYRSGAVRRAVIVGNGPLAYEIARKIECHPEMLWEVAGFLCPAESTTNGSPLAVGTSINVRSVGIAELLRSRSIDELILAVPKPSHPEISDVVARCLNQGIAVSLVPQPYELYLSRPTLVDLDGLPLLKLERVRAAHATPFWKRLFDLAVTASLLPVAGIVILGAAVWLKLRKGRGLCSEVRCGQFGRPFRMYRLNSGRDDAGLPLHEFIMQQSSFTELPQIFNVLRGEMSLVGPRPEQPERVRHYSDWHRQRLSVKPGITGLAQVHGLRDRSSSEDKTRYDLQYILHRSLFLDVSLLLQTLWTLVLRSFSRKRREFRLSQIDTEAMASTAFGESLSHAHSSQSSAD